MSTDQLQLPVPQVPRRRSFGGPPSPLPRDHFSGTSTPNNYNASRQSRAENFGVALPSNAGERAIFSVAYLTMQGTEYKVPKLRTWLFAFVDDFQLLVFPFAESIFPALPNLIPKILEPVLAIDIYSLYIIINTIAFAIVTLATCLTILVGILVRQQANPKPGLLALLRNILQLLGSALALPVMFLFFAAVKCNPWTGGLASFTGIDCSSAQHVPTMILSVVGLFMVIPMQLVISKLLVDTAPTSQSPAACAHPQVTYCAMKYRMYLVAAHTFMTSMPNAPAPQWIYALLLATLLPHLATQYILVQPFYDPVMNAMRAGLTSGAAGASLSVLFSFISTTTAGERTAWLRAILFAVGFAVVGAAASYVVGSRRTQAIVKNWRRATKESWADKSIPRLRSRRSAIVALAMGLDYSDQQMQQQQQQQPDDAPGRQLRQQQQQQQVAQQEQKEEDEGGNGVVPSTTIVITPSPAAGPLKRTGPEVVSDDTDVSIMISPPTLSFKPRSGEGSGGGQPNNPLASSASVSSIVESRLEAGRPEEHRNPINNLMQGKSIDVLAAVREREPERTKAFDSVFEVELGTRIVRSEPTAKQLVLGLQLIERGLAEFPNDSLVLLMAVTYLTAYYGEKGAHAADLLVRDLQISMRTAPMWIKYVVYAYDRSTRERGESALERALIESLWSVATKSHVRALKSTGLIWQAIFSGATAQTLGKLIRQMAGAQQIAMHNYQRLLAKCPRDQHVLRAFAQFLVSVEGNSMQANQLLSLADEFEVRDVQTFGKERNDDEDDNESGSDDSLGQVSDDSSDENDNKQDKADKEESPLAAKAQFLELGEATAIIKRSTQLHPSGGYGGSQVSGTSVVEKHVMFIRRVLLQRITQPLTMRYYLAFGWLLVLFVVCIGFRSCLQFFSNAAASQRKLFTSIAVRQQALATIENIRLMVQAPQDPLGSIVYPSVWSRLSANTTGLTLSIDQVTSWAVQSKQIWKTFRVYQPVTLPAISPARFDYAALYITPLAAAELVILAAKLALKFDGSTPASTLTTASMMANTELRILVDNFIMIQAAISEMLNTYMTEFMSFFATNNQFMWAYIAIGFVIFNIAGLLVAHFIVRPYLENEMEVVRILLRIPRKIVESLVTQTTESLECFREVTGAGENDENENAEDAIAATTSLSSSASTQAQILGKSSGSLQYYVSILLAALALSSIVGGMFGSTVGMASSSDYARVTYVSNRFYANSQWRLCSREYFYSDGTFTSDWAIQTCRSVAMDYRANHALAQVVSSGMAIDFPANTVEARDCENGCHIAEDPTIGFTLAVARQSLNAEINRLSAVADVVVSGMALGASPTDPTQQAQRQFRLSLALSNDLEGRMDDLIAAMDKQLATAILTATNLCVAMFVLAVLVLVLMMVALYKLALQHMFTTGHTLASLLTLIPYHHYHALPDLLAYLTACGIQVETGSAAAAANAAARAAAATAAASATAAGIAQRGLVVPEKDAFMLLGIDRHSTRGSKAGSPGNNRSNMGGSALAVPAAETSHPVSPTSLHSAMANTSGLGLPSRSGSKMVMVKSASALYRE